MAKKRKQDDPVESADGGLIDDDWFDEIDPDRDGEYWNPGRRVHQPRLSDEEPDND